MNDGTRVTTREQWSKRREEMKRILEYYAVGLALPPPGNVKGQRSSRNCGARWKGDLSAGPPDVSVPRKAWGWTSASSRPAEGGPFPTVIMPGGRPRRHPAAETRRKGRGKGRGSTPRWRWVRGSPPPAPSGRRRGTRVAPPIRSPGRAQSRPAHGFAYVTFNNNDCGEDTTLRNPDGSWAFRTTRFYPAYPGFDWGLLRGWAWGVSRIIDFLETDPPSTGPSSSSPGSPAPASPRWSPAPLTTGLPRWPPCQLRGRHSGLPLQRCRARRQGGPERDDEEISELVLAPSPRVLGRGRQLPFDEHWFLALAAPRPFIALEGTNDQNVNINGVRQSWLAARPAYALFGDNASIASSIIGPMRRHGMVQGDWDALSTSPTNFCSTKSRSILSPIPRRNAEQRSNQLAKSNKLFI